MIMDDKIDLHCQRCGNNWKKSLAEMEKLKTVIYRGDSSPGQGKITEYRDACPRCGTFVIAAVEED